MPRGNGTGPMGQGAMSGRGAGFCAGTGMPGYANAAAGGGYNRGMMRNFAIYNRGFGGGRGRRNMFFATGQPGWQRFGNLAASSIPTDPAWERQMLQNQAEALSGDLEQIKARLAEIEKKE